MTVSLAPRPMLLLTRPREGSEQFATQFRARFGADWPVLIAPLMEIEPQSVALGAAEALLFTSRHAIAPVLTAGPPCRKAYCVGATTAEAARLAGFEVAGEASDAAQLYEHLAALKAAGQPAGPLLHARGAETAFPLAERLNSAGIETQEAVVYAQHPRPPSPEALALLAAKAPVLLAAFSPNSARLLAGLGRAAKAPLWLAAISDKAAAACSNLPCAGLRIAPQPDREGMLTAFAQLLRDCAG